MFIFSNANKRLANINSSSSSSKATPPMASEKSSSEPTNKSPTSNAPPKLSSDETKSTDPIVNAKTKEKDRVDNNKSQPTSTKKDTASPAQDADTESPDQHKEIQSRSSTSPANGKDIPGSKDTRSSSTAHNQPGDSNMHHPFANDFIKDAKDVNHPDVEITPPSDDMSQRRSEVRMPVPLEEDNRVSSKPEELPQANQVVKKLNGESGGLKSPEGNFDRNAIPSEELIPRSYRHHHAVRKVRKVVLQRPVLKALLGRQLCETTKPALDLLASGQNIVPIDDHAMAEMKSVSPVPIIDPETEKDTFTFPA